MLDKKVLEELRNVCSMLQSNMDLYVPTYEHKLRFIKEVQDIQKDLDILIDNKVELTVINTRMASNLLLIAQVYMAREILDVSESIGE